MHGIINVARLILGFLMVSAAGSMQVVATEDIKQLRTSASPANSNAAPIRVPHAMALELEKDRQAIETEKATAAELKIELQTAKQTIDAESTEVTAQEASVEAMRKDIDAHQRNIATTDTYGVQRFNRRVKEYNILANEAIENRAHLNVSIEQYNELAKKNQAQAALVNQLAEAYNAKLRRNGH